MSASTIGRAAIRKKEETIGQKFHRAAIINKKASIR